jgi:hypothetical protein
MSTDVTQAREAIRRCLEFRDAGRPEAVLRSEIRFAQERIIVDSSAVLVGERDRDGLVGSTAYDDREPAICGSASGAVTFSHAATKKIVPLTGDTYT